MRRRQHEIQLLLDECRGHIKPVVVVALNTGMRLSEILYLKFENIDYNRTVLRVVDTKSGENRMVPMNNLVCDTLRVF